MSDTGKDQGQDEPSMEDILASIRRILSEDGEDDAKKPAAAPAPAPAAAPAPAPRPAAPRVAAAPPPPPPPPPEPEPEPELTAWEPEPEPEPMPIRDPAMEEVFNLTPAMMLQDLPRNHDVMSMPTAQASTDVLSELAKAILNKRDMASGNRDITLESMIREMLRPLLKEWMDRNLPYLIERLVKKEIDMMINRAEKLDD